MTNSRIVLVSGLRALPGPRLGGPHYANYVAPVRPTEPKRAKRAASLALGFVGSQVFWFAFVFAVALGTDPFFFHPFWGQKYALV